MSTSKPGMPGHPMLPLAAIGAYMAGSLLVWLAAGLGGLMAGTGWTGGTPLTTVVDLALGTATWPGTAGWLALAGLVLVLAAPAILVGLQIARRRKGRKRVDAATPHLATRDDFAAYAPEGVAASARRLRPSSTISNDPADHGMLVGDALPSNTEIRSSWEDVSVVIAGPRTGKSTAQVIPQIVEAPGPVLATSNKRDIHDATRGVREQLGTCWVFDPQGIADAQPSFWYNPLRRVTGPRRAAELVSHFAANSRGPDAKTDAYFDGEGENLCSYAMLAAARAGLTLTEVYTWCANHRAAEKAVTHLENAGDQLLAVKLQSLVDAPEKQREGVFASALKLLKCLEEPTVLQWVSPPPDGEDRPEFDPHAFVRSRDTAFLLSREGVGSAGPLTAAMSADILEVVNEIGAHSPGARIDPPLLPILDEAANVVRIRDLPDLVSHLGSRGAPLKIILQSWEQGAEAWGRSGIQKIWDAANVRIYGGGSADAEFLERLSKLIGQHDDTVWSVSVDRSGGGSKSSSVRERRILDVSELQALQRDRMIAFLSGSRPILLAPRAWMTGPHAGGIRYSLARYDPGHDDDDAEGAA
ncbi:type IV secretory system conjugative DNA transfer family protein [Saccharopolyspora griseoalba]|uniref:Type IV secretory system conjugative DNA transfer family protein n=1 Tax=Saccharopolyspora griseoalba TaxID=1431848 RepID=A0ABW2LR05_9PSEU